MQSDGYITDELTKKQKHALSNTHHK